MSNKSKSTLDSYVKEYNRFINSGLSEKDYLNSIQNKNTRRKILNALKSFNIIPTTTKAPTIKAPTIKAPTTKAPTTKAPTTKAPTTKAPTKSTKKQIDIQITQKRFKKLGINRNSISGTLENPFKKIGKIKHKEMLNGLKKELIKRLKGIKITSKTIVQIKSINSYKRKDKTTREIPYNSGTFLANNKKNVEYYINDFIDFIIDKSLEYSDSVEFMEFEIEFFNT